MRGCSLGCFALFSLAAVLARAQQTSELPELKLEEALSLALDHNRLVQIAELQTKRAVEELAANRTRRFANLQITGLGAQLLTRPSITFPAGSFGSFPGTGLIPATATTISAPRRPVALVFASILQPLSAQYRLHLQLKAMSLGVEGAREDERKKRQETANEVRRIYFEIAAAQSDLAALAASMPLYLESKRLAAENKKAETVLGSQALRADVQFAQAENANSDARQRLAATKERLNDLLGRDIHTGFRVASTEAQFSEFEQAEVLEARALKNRPEVRKARLLVQQAGYASRAKKAEYIPDVSLAADYLTAANFGTVLPGNIAAAGLQVSWEPWDWGRKRHELTAARSQEQEARLAAEATERAVSLEVANAVRQLGAARRAINLSEAVQKAARQKLAEAQLQAAKEAILTRDLLAAQAELADVDSKHQLALTAFWKASADLNRAMGEDQ
jgi:outer membrane protein TolC